MLVFFDTSALKAYYDSGDAFHAKARGFMERVARREVAISSFITTDYVLDEAITVVRFAHSHEKAAEFGRASLSSRLLKVEYTDEETFKEAFELFRKYSDKQWSFTDCVSFTTMKRLSATKAFAFDEHFRQARFETFP
jgi:predicted nucleic acid-binding protein